MKLNLLSPECFNILIVNMKLNSPDCMKMFISRGLGLAIIGKKNFCMSKNLSKIFVKHLPKYLSKITPKNMSKYLSKKY